MYGVSIKVENRVQKIQKSSVIDNTYSLLVIVVNELSIVNIHSAKIKTAY